MNFCGQKKRVRKREDRSLTEWLMGKNLYAENRIGLSGAMVSIPFLSNKEFELDEGSTEFVQFGYKIVPSKTVISATKEQVWNVILNFDLYNEWNPLQRQITILEPKNERGNVGFELKTDNFGTVKQEVLYLDEKRFIFIYGKKNVNFRAQWLTDDGNGSTIYHSFDNMIGYAPILFVKLPWINSMLLKLFNEQHHALKERVEKEASTHTEIKEESVDI